jgi:hypothetical protein
MPKKIADKNLVFLEDLDEDEFTELVNELAQQTDIKTTNLQVNIEELDKAADGREKKRWKTFLIVASTILIPILIIGFETWERHYDRLNNVRVSIEKQEVVIGYLKEQIQKADEDRKKKDDEVQASITKLTEKINSLQGKK